MQETIDKLRPDDWIRFISFEDLNTTGLSGVPDENNLMVDGSWSSYAYYNGHHHEVDNHDGGAIRGGSRGIGKIASIAASDLHLMYFMNCDQEGNQHIGGNISLFDHKLDGEIYSGTGYFTQDETINGRSYFYPYKNTYDYPFDKKTRGLKILIPFLANKYLNKDEIVKTVCDSFFVSILESDLIVSIDDQVIDAEAIRHIVKDRRYYPNQDRQDMKDDCTSVYIDTYLNYKKDEKFVVRDGNNKNYKFDLYFQMDRDIKSGRWGIVRRMAMRIENRKVPRFINNGPYNAIIIPSDLETDRFIKTMENPSHTVLDYSSIPSPSESKNAKKFLRNLEKTMQEYLENSIKEDLGKRKEIDTSDMIYSMENILKTQTSKIDTDYSKMSILDLASKKKERDKISKSKDNSGMTTRKPKRRKKDQERRRTPEFPEINPVKKNKSKRQRNPNTGLEPEYISKGKVERSQEYSRKQIPTNDIKRIVIDNKEYLSFDLSEFNDIDLGKCNIYLNRIDGEGNQEEDKFFLD